MNLKKIATLITCYNRKAATLACLESLYGNHLPKGYSLDVFLVDDGSTDGTEDEVRERYPEICIIKGDGNLYWNRGMHLAFAKALEKGFDYYLWLNDDTFLFPHAITDLLQTQLPGWTDDFIVAGATSDPATGGYTYGGIRHSGRKFRPFLCHCVFSQGTPQEVDVINGNVVLIPDSVARKVGNLDPIFEHAMGDTDYSMRARKLGIKIVLTSDYVAHCSRNEIKNTYRDNTIPLKRRLKLALSRKGLPWRSWLVMCLRHGGWLWPVHFLLGYFKVIIGRAL